MKTVITCADYLLSFIQVNLDATHVFGVPGGAIEPFFNSFANTQTTELIVARSENGAACMGEGYYKETGKIPVVCSTTGPGATNLITSVSNAYIEHTPMLVITPQTPLHKFGHNALQESSCTAVDTVAILKHITCFSTLVSHKEQLSQKLYNCLIHLQIHKRPVHISIPSDILRSVWNDTNNVLLNHPTKVTLPDIVPKFINTTQITQKLAQSNKPVLFVGSGCYDNGDAIQRFCNRTNIPYVCSPQAKGCVNEHDKKFFGVYGFATHSQASLCLQESDLIIIIGSSLNEIETCGWNSLLFGNNIVHIDQIYDNFAKTSKIGATLIYGNISDVLLTIDSRSFPKRERQDELFSDFAFDDTKPDTVRPDHMMDVLSKTLPNDTRVFIDAGNVWAWSIHFFLREQTTNLYRISMSYGAMTWSIGASIGSCLATKQPTVCIVGDGSWLMSSMELSVAVQHQLPIVFIILNDSSLGMVRHGQQLGGQHSIGWQLPDTNYSTMAQSVGSDGLVVTNILQIQQIDWNALFTKSIPTVIDVHINDGCVPPMLDRVKGLSNQATFTTPGG